MSCGNCANKKPGERINVQHRGNWLHCAVCGDVIREQQISQISSEMPPTPSDDDAVNNPDHYTRGGIETLDFIRAKLTPEQFIGYCWGNVLKYTARWPFKNGKQDLRKAQFYLNELLAAKRTRVELDGGE